MNIRTLTNDEVKKVYNKLLKKDFPLNERRPLLRINRLLQDGKYICLGAFKNEKLISYGFFCINDKCLLLDYFAVIKEERAKGVGSEVIKKFTEDFNEYVIFLEAENPGFAKTKEDKALRERRIKFYKSSGFSDTGIKTNVFGVEYVILVFPGNKASDKEIEKIFTISYKTLFQTRFFMKRVKIYR